MLFKIFYILILINGPSILVVPTLLGIIKLLVAKRVLISARLDEGTDRAGAFVHSGGPITWLTLIHIQVELLSCHSGHWTPCIIRTDNMPIIIDILPRLPPL